MRYVVRVNLYGKYCETMLPEEVARRHVAVFIENGLDASLVVLPDPFASMIDSVCDHGEASEIVNAMSVE